MKRRMILLVGLSVVSALAVMERLAPDDSVIVIVESSGYDLDELASPSVKMDVVIASLPEVAQLADNSPADVVNYDQHCVEGLLAFESDHLESYRKEDPGNQVTGTGNRGKEKSLAYSPHSPPIVHTVTG